MFVYLFISNFYFLSPIPSIFLYQCFFLVFSFVLLIVLLLSFIFLFLFRFVSQLNHKGGMSGVDTVYHCHKSFFGCVAHCSISKRKKERKKTNSQNKEREKEPKKVHNFFVQNQVFFLNRDRNLNSIVVHNIKLFFAHIHRKIKKLKKALQFCFKMNDIISL